jgi:hypothetical protein
MRTLLISLAAFVAAAVVTYAVVGSRAIRADGGFAR